nr:MAG TPA: hypothetical protein [Caudoviricetes sp.]
MRCECAYMGLPCRITCPAWGAFALEQLFGVEY